MNQQVTVINQGGGKYNEWSHELFGCFDDCGECLLASCFPCITFGLNARDSGTCCCGGCCGVFCGCIMFFTPCGICAWCCGIRPEIRRKYRIQNNCCQDCLAVCCCPCCALIQERQQCKTATPGQQVMVQNVITMAPQSYATDEQYLPADPNLYGKGHSHATPQHNPPGPSQQYPPGPPQQYRPGPPQQYPLRPS